MAAPQQAPQPRRYRHVRIPVSLLEDSDVTPAAIAVYAALAKYANAHLQCWPSVKAVAETAKLSRRTVFRELQWLEDGWFIRRQQRKGPKGQATTLYTLTPDRMIQRSDDGVSASVALTLVSPEHHGTISNEN